MQSFIRANVAKDISGGNIVGCMAASCHGSNHSDAPTWQRSGTIWFDKDPHAVAYVRLLNEQSLDMVNRLLDLKIKTVESQEYVEALAQRCISCHSNSLVAASDRVLGVDCQVCHGSASSWNQVHYSPEWIAAGDKRYEESNMRNTNSLASRAMICSSCHIGELNTDFGDREVTHELMAAGHPPMHFDFMTYLSRYPKHWEDDSDAAGTSQSSFRTWRIGKLATAVSRLRLLADRAKEVRTLWNSKALKSDGQALQHSNDTREPTGRTWPEFAEYSCYKCHHPIQEKVLIGEHKGNSIFTWDSWTIAEIESAVQSTDLNKLRIDLEKLEGVLETPSPDPLQAIEATEPLLRFLESELAEIRSADNMDKEGIRHKLVGLMQHFPTGTSWERVVPWFLATRALAKDLQLNLPDQILVDAEKQLGFPSMPGTSVRMEGPFRFEPKCLDTYRTTLLDLLKN